MLLACLLALSAPALPADPAPEVAGAAAPIAPAAWLAGYDALRAALVADDVAASASAARALAPLVAGDGELAAAAERVAAGADVAAQRLAFADLSRLAVLRISAAGAPKVIPYHCPMVSGYGYWVQAKSGIANPYMGQSMPHCGSEVSLKAAVKAAEAGR